MEVKDRGHSMNEPNKYNRVNVLKRKLREKSLALLKQGKLISIYVCTKHRIMVSHR